MKLALLLFFAGLCVALAAGHENDQKGRVAKSQAEVGELNEIEAGLLRKGREAEAARQNNGGRRRSRQRTKRKNLRNKRRNRKTRKSRKNRKNGKATRKGTRKTRRNGKTRRNKNSRRKAKRTRQNKQRLNRAGQGRQLAADCYGALQNASKKYIQYSNQLRKLKRVKGWAKVMDNKKTSSDSTFNDAKDSINNATGSGKTCKGSSITGDAMKNQEKLNNCSKSAKAKCDKGQISGLNSSLLDTCQPKLEKWTKKYQDCVRMNTTTLSCSCIKDIGTVESSCLAFDNLNAKTKEARNKCVKSTEAGSFGDCRKAEREAVKFAVQCITACPSGSTKKLVNRRDILRNIRNNMWKNK